MLQVMFLLAPVPLQVLQFSSLVYLISVFFPKIASSKVRCISYWRSLLDEGHYYFCFDHQRMNEYIFKATCSRSTKIKATETLATTKALLSTCCTKLIILCLFEDHLKFHTLHLLLWIFLQHQVHDLNLDDIFDSFTIRTFYFLIRSIFRNS